MEYSKELTYNVYEFDNLSKEIILKEAYRKIIICKSNTNKVKITCIESKRSKYKFVYKDSIKITSPNTKLFAKKELKKEYIKIEIPEGRVFSFIIKSKAGLIQFEDICAHNIKIDCENANINFKNIIAHEVSIKATETAVSIDTAYTTSKVKIKTTDALVRIRNIDFAKNLDIKNEYGSVRLYFENACSRYGLKLKSKKGKIKVCGEDYKDYKKRNMLFKRKQIKVKTLKGNIGIYCN